MSNSERAPPVRKSKRAGQPCDRSRPARLEPPRARDRAPSSFVHRTSDACAAQIPASSASQSDREIALRCIRHRSRDVVYSEGEPMHAPLVLRVRTIRTAGGCLSGDVTPWPPVASATPKEGTLCFARAPGLCRHRSPLL
jgi:hypothetical protein